MFNSLFGAVFGSTTTDDENDGTCLRSNNSTDNRIPRSPVREHLDPQFSNRDSIRNTTIDTTGYNSPRRSVQSTSTSTVVAPTVTSSTNDGTTEDEITLKESLSSSPSWRIDLDQFNARISQIYMHIAENELEAAVHEYADVQQFITSVPFPMLPLQHHQQVYTQSSSSSPVINNTLPSSDDPRQEMVSALCQRLTDYIANRMNQARNQGDMEKVRNLWCLGATVLVHTSTPTLTNNKSNTSISSPPSIFTSIFGELVKSQFRDYVNETLLNFQYNRIQQLQDSLTIHQLDRLSQTDPYYKDTHYNIIHLPHPYFDRHLFTIIETAGIKMSYHGKSISFVQPHEQTPISVVNNSLDHTVSSSSSSSSLPSEGYSIGYSLSPSTIIPAPSENTPSMIVEVLTTILSEATIWMSQIMEQDVPITAKYHIIAIIHAEVVEACLPLLQAYREDSQLDATLAIARTLLNYAENRLTNQDKGLRKHFEHTLETIVHYRTTRIQSNDDNGSDTVSFLTNNTVSTDSFPVDTENRETEPSTFSSSSSSTPPPLTSVTYAAVTEEEDPILITRFDNCTSSSQPKKKNKSTVVKYTVPTTPYVLEPSVPLSPVPSSYAPLPLPLSSSTGIIDETCDQLSYVCAILEKYLRYTTVSLGLGNADQPSRMDDELAIVMHGLQGEYVLLERTYLENAIARAANTSKGWLPVSMSEDANVRTFAWVDMAFFILSKAIARACGTYCDMAAAAVINFVTNCLDQNIRKVINECIELCRTERKDNQNNKNETLEVNPANLPTRRHNAYSVGDEAEEELARQLQQVLLGGKKSSTITNGNHENIGSDNSFSNDNEDDDMHRVHEPAVAAIAIYACNTVHTASLFVRSLYERTCGEVSTIFPLPYNDNQNLSTQIKNTSDIDVSHLGYGNDNTNEDLPLPLCHPYLRVPLDTFRTVIRGRDTNILSSSFSSHSLSLSSSTVNTNNDNQQGYNALLENAYTVLARTAGRAGFDQLITLFQSSVSSSSSSSAFAAFTGKNEKAPTLRYILNEQEYDTLTTTSTADALLNVFHSQLLIGSGLSTLLSLLRQPQGTDMFLQAMAKQVAIILQNGWINNKLSINEYGALLLAAELRDIEARLSSYTRSGTTLVRKYFTYLEQCMDIWTLDALSDIYSLAFPVPLLSKEEIIQLLHQRVGLIKSTTALEAIQWEKVKCITPKK